MKKILFLLLFIPLVSFGQYTRVTDLGFEQIWYGKKINSWNLAKYEYDGNPFNDNEKTLIIFPDYINFNIRTTYSSDGDKTVYRATKEGLNFLYVSKSDLEPEKFVVNVSEYQENDILYDYGDKYTWEFIFDDDKSTYLIIDRNNAKNITSLEHEIFLKFKKHRKVIVRQTVYNYRFEVEKVKDYNFSLTGFTAAYNKYMEIEAPTMKNKNKYKVANGLANVNPFNLDKYIDKFILDAKTNHNIDLSYVNKRDKLIMFRELEGETIAAAYKMNDDGKVLVIVDPENWQAANQSKRWYIIYHELGHDILNLEHGECGPMMNERASSNYSWDRLEKDKNIMFEKYKSKT